MSRPDGGFRTINSSYAYEAATPDEISFRVDEVEFPSGRVGTYAYAEYPFEVCFVLPVNDAGELLLIRQHRYPIGEELLEVPAGSPLPGESLEDCARRESEEETGFPPRDIQRLFTFYPSPGVERHEGASLPRHRARAVERARRPGRADHSGGREARRRRAHAASRGDAARRGGCWGSWRWRCCLRAAGKGRPSTGRRRARRQDAVTVSMACPSSTNWPSSTSIAATAPATGDRIGVMRGRATRP